MSATISHDPKLARMLILDELFDLSLYKALREITDRESQKVLDELILVEMQHLAFWQKFFDSTLTTLDLGRRFKLRFMVLVCRIFGVPAVHLVLEAIEVHGVRKYLSLWKSYHDQPLGAALRGILMDEFKHEDVLVTQLTERKINPERIRNIFFGLNDGLVEILGAVSGFFGAFGDAVTVLIAASTTAVAGALSMAAGAYVALNSEKEVQQTEADKKRFLGEGHALVEMGEQPLSSAVVVGGAYIVGAMVPVLPVLFGAKDDLVSLVTAGSMIIVVSMLLAFLSGMNVKRRILVNLVIIAAAVGISYGIGIIAGKLWGVSI
jgi:VIT1/CCC1 family predicted Fe2+/Mn2+ transporter